MKKAIFLRNNAHGTSLTIWAEVVREGLLFVSELQATQARERLCGWGISCGNSLGERPAPSDCVPTPGGYLYHRN